MAKAKAKGKPAPPKDPDVRTLEGSEIITDNHPGTPTPIPEAPDHRGPLPNEEVTLLNDNFDRLSTIESIAKRQAEAEGIEYEDTPLKKEDFEQIHGPTGRRMKPPSEPVRPVELPPASDDKEPEAKPDTPTAPTPAAALPGRPKEPPVKDPGDSGPETKPQPLPLKFTVDGQEMEFTEDEVRTAVQKHAAANKRLMEASEALKRAQELEKRLTGQLPASPQLESDRPGDSSPRPRPVIPATRQVTPELRTRVRDLTRALQFGDEQEAEEKLLQFALDTGPAAFNEEQLLTKTVTRAEEERTKKEIRAAFEAPPEEGGYGDIAADPVLYQAIALEIQNAVTPTDQGGLGMDPFDWGTYKQYGEKFRRDYLSHRVDSKNLEDKKQQKRQLETLPQANVAPTPGVGEAPPDDPNPSATIAEMARARGQNI